MGQTRNTKRAKSDGRRRTRKTFGQRIIEGLTEAVEALERGERLDDHFPTNTIEIPAPTQYGPDTVRALRSRMGVSQRVFAKLLGVGVAAFIFDVTRPTLLQMNWFRRLYEFVLMIRARAVELVAPVTARIKAMLKMFRANSSSRWMRLIQRIRHRMQSAR